LQLQWSRRANATETRPVGGDGAEARVASMEPSRERDGDRTSGSSPSSWRMLQWSRRANATETLGSGLPRKQTAGRFNGAVARTRRRRPGIGGDLGVPQVASMEPSRERDGDAIGVQLVQ